MTRIVIFLLTVALFANILPQFTTNCSLVQGEEYRIERAHFYRNDKNGENKSYIDYKYPQIRGLKDKRRQVKINELLRNQLLSRFYDYWTFKDYGSHELELDYEVKNFDNDILSIVWKGSILTMSDSSFVAYAVNISLKDAKILKLLDIVDINKLEKKF